MRGGESIAGIVRDDRARFVYQGDSQALTPAGQDSPLRGLRLVPADNDMSSMKIDVLPFSHGPLRFSVPNAQAPQEEPISTRFRQHGGKFFWPINADVAAAVGCLHGQLRLGLRCGKVSTLPGEGEQGRQR